MTAEQLKVALAVSQEIEQLTELVTLLDRPKHVMLHGDAGVVGLAENARRFPDPYALHIKLLTAQYLRSQLERLSAEFAAL